MIVNTLKLAYTLKNYTKNGKKCKNKIDKKILKSGQNDNKYPKYMSIRAPGQCNI